jgi:3-hydroxyacyl-[acyl-carrier-protein] dehydratase
MSLDARTELLSADIQMIQRLLPHRYPFLLIDKVRDIVPFKSAVGVKNVTYNEPHFQGHFPGVPIMPGVTIIEAMAQTAAVMVGVSSDYADKELLVYFMGIDRAKFRRKVGPGDVLELAIEVTRGKPGGKVWKFAARATVEGELAAECEFTAMMDMPADGPPKERPNEHRILGAGASKRRDRRWRGDRPRLPDRPVLRGRAGRGAGPRRRAEVPCRRHRLDRPSGRRR